MPDGSAVRIQTFRQAHAEWLRKNLPSHSSVRWECLKQALLEAGELMYDMGVQDESGETE